MFFFFNDTATTEIYTLSLHDALPISRVPESGEYAGRIGAYLGAVLPHYAYNFLDWWRESLRPEMDRNFAYLDGQDTRSEEHTSELQSRQYLVCRLLLEKKKQRRTSTT